MCVCVCVGECLYISIYVCVYVCVCVYECVYISVYMCVCVCVRVYSKPGGGHSNPLQYSCLENPMDKGGAWRAMVHMVAMSWTRLEQLSTHAHILETHGSLVRFG